MGLNFLGGINLKDDYEIKKISITEFYSPSLVTVGLVDDAVPVVSTGNNVLQGMPVAQNNDGFSVISPVSGKVTDVNDSQVTVSNDFKDEKYSILQPFNRQIGDITVNHLIDITKKAGIIESFSGIPVYKKLAGAYQNVHRIIISCIDNDPDTGFLSMLAREKSKEIIYGIKLLMHCLGVKKTVVSVIAGDECRRELNKHVNDKNMIVFAELSPKYPQGEEKLLVSSIYNVELPMNKKTYESGYMILSAETVYNIYNSISTGEPAIYKNLTVSVPGKKMNIRTNIGTPFSEILDNFMPGTEKMLYISGNMLNGYVIDRGFPVRPDTGGLKAIFPVKNKNGACIKCARCVSVCPMHLMPYVYAGNYLEDNCENSTEYGIYNCIECGCCSYICPGRVDILEYIRRTKQGRIVDTVVPEPETDHVVTEEKDDFIDELEVIFNEEPVKREDDIIDNKFDDTDDLS